MAYSSLQPHRVYGVGQKGTGTGPAAEYTALGECVKLDAVLKPFIACFGAIYRVFFALLCHPTRDVLFLFFRIVLYVLLV